MGRSSFEKIRGNLELSSLLKTWDEFPKVWNPEQLFGASAPVELEIGSGKGLFLRKAAAANREHLFLGIEVAYRYALISAAGLAKNGIMNAVMVNADAAKLLAETVPSNSLAAVHVYFPDPWWKKAHRKRRILREDVLKMIEDRLIPGGTFYFRTDVEEYFHSTLDLAKAQTTLLGPVITETGTETVDHSAANPVERGADNPPARMTGDAESQADFEYSTHFERRTRLHHLPVYGCHWTKRA